MFSITEPDGVPETPLLVEVPHAGLDVPPTLGQCLIAPARSIARDADLYVDALYQDAPLDGATLICARVSRYVVDLNRAESDIDGESVEGGRASPKAPRGLIWRLSTDGNPCMLRPLPRHELEARLAAVYRPYHAAIAEIVARKRARFGFAIVLAAHSMPGVGRSINGEAGLVRADVVPGTLGRTSANSRFIDAVDAHARGAGMTVKHDDPYRGGFTTRHYGRPHDGMHTVQVELARRIYMDETGLAPRDGKFAAVRAWCRDLARTLGSERPSFRG
jgi:hypothetical protein